MRPERNPVRFEQIYQKVQIIDGIDGVFDFLENTLKIRRINLKCMSRFFLEILYVILFENVRPTLARISISVFFKPLQTLAVVTSYCV